jgi:tetratricopeptide (TPR) repeat protein
MFLTTKVATVSAILPFVYPIMHTNKARSSWGELVVLAVLLHASFAASQHWATRIQDGINLHHRYMHSRATKAIVAAAKEVGGDHQRQIAALLLDEANKLLSRPSDRRDEVGARGLLQSSMAVSVLVDDAEQIYNAAGGFLLAGSSQEALEGYKRVQRMVPSLAAAYHQIGMTLSKMNKLEDSIDAYNAALGLLPTYAISYNNLGVLLAKMGRTQVLLLLSFIVPCASCINRALEQEEAP